MAQCTRATFTLRVEALDLDLVRRWQSLAFDMVATEGSAVRSSAMSARLDDIIQAREAHAHGKGIREAYRLRLQILMTLCSVSFAWDLKPFGPMLSPRVSGDAKVRQAY